MLVIFIFTQSLMMWDDFYVTSSSFHFTFICSLPLDTFFPRLGCDLTVTERWNGSKLFLMLKFCVAPSYLCMMAEGCPRHVSPLSCTWVCCCHAVCSPGHTCRWWCCQRSGPGHLPWSQTGVLQDPHNVTAQSLKHIQITMLAGTYWKRQSNL